MVWGTPGLRVHGPHFGNHYTEESVFSSYNQYSLAYILLCVVAQECEDNSSSVNMSSDQKK